MKRDQFFGFVYVLPNSMIAVTFSKINCKVYLKVEYLELKVHVSFSTFSLDKVLETLYSSHLSKRHRNAETLLYFLT